MPLRSKTLPVVKNAMSSNELIAKNYQTYLREYFGDQEITITEKEAAEQKEMALEFRPQYEIDFNHAYNVVTNKLHISNAPFLYTTSDAIECTKTILWLLDEKIEQLNIAFQQHDNEIINVMEQQRKNNIIAQLKKLSATLSTENWGESTVFQNTCVADHYIKYIDQLIQNPNPTLKEAQQSADALDHKLVGTHINTSLRAAIFGVIGAVVGLILGVLIAGAAQFGLAVLAQYLARSQVHVQVHLKAQLSHFHYNVAYYPQ